VAAEILAHLEIATPFYEIVWLSATFLEANPEVTLETGVRHIAPEPGWHFGSRHPGDPETLALFDFVPDSLLAQVANAEQFLAVLAFDRWTANADSRQAVFFRAQLKDWLARPGAPPRKLGFVALMIDHGFVFNGPHWELPDSALTGLYARRSVYTRVRSLADFEPWIERIRACPPEVLDRALSRIPPPWIGPDSAALEKLLETLLRRRGRIADLIAACRSAPGNPFPNWR
jgi:hypothetical protein